MLLIYKLISHPIVQLLATAFFTFYASEFCITEKGSINLLGVLVYFIVYLLFYIVNNHRKKRAQETNLIEDALQTQTTVIHQMREQKFVGHKSHLALVAFFLEMLLLPQIPCIAKISIPKSFPK